MILIDLERLRYPNSGLANVFRNIAKGIETQNKPFEVYYFGPEDELAKYINRNNIVPYRKWHKYFENFSQNFQLIHISNQGTPHFRKNYTNTIKILTLHDLNFLYENLTEAKKKRIYNRINKSFETVDYLVCISNFVKDDFLKNKHLFNFKKLKGVSVIYNGIELPESRTYELGKYNFLKNKKYILNIGVLFEKKNQKSLIEMLPYIEEDFVSISSEEKEPYTSELKERIKQLGMENRVHFLKNVSEEEKYAIIQNCRALCHPSIAEGFGIPPIEAMAFGKPVFLSNKTSLPEIGGSLAFYFDNFNPKEMVETYKKGIDTFSQNPNDFSEKIKLWAKQFDYQIMAKKYLDLYKKVLEDN